MAYIDTIFCTRCQERRQVLCSANKALPSLCDRCKQLEEDEKYKKHCEHLDSLTIEERVRKIENWIYNYKPYDNPFDMRF